LLKLAVVLGYAVVLMVSLFGSPSLRAQSSPTVTPVTSSLTARPATLKFGTQLVLPPDGVAGSPKTLTLNVASNQPQPVTIESIASSDPLQFIVQPNSCTVIAPGSSCPVSIVYKPNGLKRRNAVLMVTSNAANSGGVLSVNLTGATRQGRLTISPRSLSFPLAEIGATPSAAKSVTLTNKNAVQMTISQIASSNPDVFQLDNSCPNTLQPSAQCTFGVSFAADRNGSISGRINITDNAAGPNRVSLSGSGRGSPTVTRTATPTRSPTPSPTKNPGPYPMRAFPVMH
jgi:hypothetical protein